MQPPFIYSVSAEYIKCRAYWSHFYAINDFLLVQTISQLHAFVTIWAEGKGRERGRGKEEERGVTNRQV
jgi:hypothetical protein